ncbi:hypothetical protein Tco_1239151 [Tanacetum coccineum]
MGSMLMANGEECLDGWVRAGGGEVMCSGVDFGVSRSLLGEILGEIMDDKVGEGLMEVSFGSQWVVIEDDREVTPDEDWRSNKGEH